MPGSKVESGEAMLSLVRGILSPLGRAARGKPFSPGPSGARMPIATKLILGFVSVIVITSVTFSLVGVRLIGSRVVSEAQAKVHTDLNAAREIYLNRLSKVHDVVRFTADRFFLQTAILSGDVSQAAQSLRRILEREHLDVLTVTDRSGVVLWRTSNPEIRGDSQAGDALVREAIARRAPVSSTCIVSAQDLQRESPVLAEKAYIRFVHTPMARKREETEQRSGMMLKAAAPVFDFSNGLIGAVYGGVLLNRDIEIVDKIKQTVFQDVKYKGKDIGTATIFEDDVRISTNVTDQSGRRAIGTRAAEDVYDQVALRGRPWSGRAYVVNNWYIAAYEPIRGAGNQIVGILYVGIIEEKYLDIKGRTTSVLLGITLIGAMVAITLSYFISRSISVSIRKLVSASKELAHGNLDAKVEIRSNDELRELADTFNIMGAALKKRDEKLKEFATRKIMESERLAIVGQLAAGVAHELNNPLQGIVAYSHLLLERMPAENPYRDAVQKIVNQANRCTDTVRGLLDFSRQRKPHKRSSSVNAVLEECVSLVENQSLFHNIRIVRDYGEDLPRIVIDPSQIQQVFMNMTINAAEAMSGSGQLTLSTRFVPLERSVEVRFSDTGHGINEEDMERIFDPFFTTKETGHGTGLGLAISYGIIKEHRGTVSVDSEVGAGTAFLVKLPVVEAEGVESDGKQRQDIDHR